MKRALLVAFIALVCPGCLVLSINPAYDDDSLTWNPDLIGAWQSVDDKSSIDIRADEWKSYRIRYEHPSETGEVTGYLTVLGNSRYLDVMPVRGHDRGSFLIPVHVVLRLKLESNRLELTPLSYDWFFGRLRSTQPVAGLKVMLDQKENALIGSSTPALREWLRDQPLDGGMFGVSAVFVRKP